MKFASLQLGSWRQFRKIEIDFHERMTILTGANGAGKSTILRLLATHFGWHNQLLSTPTEGKEGIFKYLTGADRRLLKRVLYQQKVQNPAGVQHVQQPLDVVGSIRYSNGAASDIGVPENTGAIYNPQLMSQQPVQGLYIPSHRMASNYQQVTSIPTNPINASNAYSTFWQALMHRYNNGQGNVPSPMYRMKETIISMAALGPGNRYVSGNERADWLFEHFTHILKELLPPSLGFQKVTIRIPDIVMVTKSGEFVLDAASGGVMSIIELAWQLFLYSNDKNEFVAVLDEPENHLHPSMQREILSRLIEAFPHGQFVVATHSPFIVSSVRDSTVYALRYHDSAESNESPNSQSVSSLRLDLGTRASSASDILREVLGVPVTLPGWAEEDLRRIAGEFQIESIDSQSIADLRTRLEAAGLGEYYPDALRQMAGGR